MWQLPALFVSPLRSLGSDNLDLDCMFENVRTVC